MSSPDVPPLVSRQVPTSPAPAFRHRGLVVTSATLATAGMLVAAAYGIAQDMFVLRALAWYMALAALTTWVCLHACRLRRRFELAERASDSDDRDDRSAVRSPSWEADLEDVEVTDAAMGRWDVEHTRQLHYLFLAVIPTALILLLGSRSLWTSVHEVVVTPPAGTATALALVCLAASCLWLMLAAPFRRSRWKKCPTAQAWPWCSVRSSGPAS